MAKIPVVKTLLNGVVADGSSDAIDLLEHTMVELQAEGMTNADMQYEESNDGTTWYDAAATINSTDGLTTINPFSARFLRATVENYVAGTIIVTVLAK